MAENDNLTVTPNGKELTIRYVHRDTAYEIKTDKEGNIDLDKGVSSAIVCDASGASFVLKKDLLKADGDASKMSSLDWSKVKLAPDKADAAKKYSTTKGGGKLTATYAKDVLQITGTMALQ
jgi:hypothetical protein